MPVMRGLQLIGCRHLYVAHAVLEECAIGWLLCELLHSSSGMLAQLHEVSALISAHESAAPVS